jgi:hypothetical protein
VIYVCVSRNDGHRCVPDDNGDNLMIRLMWVQITVLKRRRW